MSEFKFLYNGKKINMDVKICDNFFLKFSGLMLQKKSKPLLFLFHKPVYEGIHSFFCVPFVAIWFNEGKIIEIKTIFPWKPYVVPKKKFDKLLEIPINNKNFKYFSRN